MPNLDGTGPWGTGGRCTPLLMSGQISRPLGGFGRGVYGRRAPGMGGRGRGNMNMFYATGLPGWNRTPAVVEPITPTALRPVTEQTKEQEITSLEERINVLRQELGEAENRIKELKGDEK